MNKKNLILTTSLVLALALTVGAADIQINTAAQAPQAPASDSELYYHAIPSTPAGGQAIKVVESNDDTDYVIKAFKMKHKGIVNEIRAILERSIQKENGKSKSIVNNVNGDEYLIVTVPSFQLPYIEAVIEQLDAEGTKFAGGGTERFVYYCKNRLATDLQKYVVATMGSGHGEVVPDNLTGRIMINDAPSCAKTVKNWLPYFDVAPQQIRLECQIIEIENSDDFNFGLALEAWKEALPESVDMTLDWDNRTQGNAPGPEGWARYIAQNVKFSGMRPKAMANFINYLVRNGHAKVLSSPEAVALNGQTTIIESVDNVNYKGYNSDPNKSLDKQVQSGVILEITPIIGTESIWLEVNAEVNSVVGWTTGALPIVNTRRTSATVGVVSGETSTISGLKREYITKSDERVPVLGYIPLLGYVFRHEVDVKRDSEIVILVTPYDISKDLKHGQEKVEAFEKEYKAESEEGAVERFVDRVILNKVD